MRARATRLFLLITAILVLPAAQAGAETARQTQAPQVFKLENGLEVAVIPDNRVAIVGHAIYYKVGGVDDGPGQSGRAHFLEHMMFKATRTHPKRFFDRAVVRAGGIGNATTGFDATSYYQIVPKSELAQMMTLEADRMTNIQFTDEEMDVERGAILQERKMRVDSVPLMRLEEKVTAVLFAGTPYARLPVGSTADIHAINTASALDLYRRSYGPNNAVLVVAGDVTVEEVRELAERTYGRVAPLSTIPERAANLDLAPLTGKRIEERDAQIAQPSITRYFRAPAIGHADAEALSVLSNYLNINSGPLKTELIDRLGIASWTGAAMVSTRLGTVLKVGVGAAPGVPLATVETELDRVLAAVRSRGVPEPDVKSITKAQVVAELFAEDDIVGRMAQYGELLAGGYPMGWIEARYDRLRAVTAADVERAAGRYLDTTNSVAGVLLPAATSAAAAPSPATR